MKRLILFLFLLLIFSEVSADHEKIPGSQTGDRTVLSDSYGFDTVRDDLFLDTDTESPNQTEAVLKSVTVMIYMAGGNMEDGSNPEGPAVGTRDLIEMAKSEFDEDAVNVVVFLGGSRKWWISGIPEGTGGIYQVTNGGLRKLFNDGSAYNMGDPSTLSSFLAYSYAEFPAEQFALIFWGHGEGPNGGLCYDELFGNDSLELTELNAALQNSPFGNDKKLTWLGFDACYMGSLEISSVISDFAEYMIASGGIVPPSGWDYTFLHGIEADTDPLEICHRISDLYLNSREDSDILREISCTDLSQIPSLLASIDSFFGDIYVTPDNFAEILSARQNMRIAGDRSDSLELVEMYSLIDELTPLNASKAKWLRDALSACTVYSVSSDEAISGLTLYFPGEYHMDSSESGLPKKTVSISSQYDRFITQFFELLKENAVNPGRVIHDDSVPVP